MFALWRRGRRLVRRDSTHPTLFSDSPWYQTDVCMRLSSQLGEEGFLPSEHGATIIEEDRRVGAILPSSDDRQPVQAAWHGRNILPILRLGEMPGTPAAKVKPIHLEASLTGGR